LSPLFRNLCLSETLAWASSLHERGSRAARDACRTSTASLLIEALEQR
jgi:hypothetical protein